MKTSRTRLRTLVAPVAAALLFGCGGSGGGGGGAGVGSGGGGSGATFSTQLTDIDLTNTQRSEPVDANGLPIGGATITTWP